QIDDDRESNECVGRDGPSDCAIEPRCGFLLREGAQDRDPEGDRQEDPEDPSTEEPPDDSEGYRQEWEPEEQPTRSWEPQARHRRAFAFLGVLGTVRKVARERDRGSGGPPRRYRTRTTIRGTMAATTDPGLRSSL